MDQTIINFHTFIRRYCIDRRNTLKENRLIAQLKALGIYEEVKAMPEDQAIEAIFEKIKRLDHNEFINIENDPALSKKSYNINIDILEIILQNIEKIDPLQFESLNDIKNASLQNIQSSKISDNSHYHSWSKKEKEKIIETEISHLISLIKKTDKDDLKEISPLFFRRVLSNDEEKTLLLTFKNKWHKKAEQSEHISNTDYLRLHEDEFKKIFKRENIVEILLHRGENRVYELNTWDIDGASYEMDTHIILTNPNSELYWCTQKMDWALIKDHEGYYHIWGDCFINHAIQNMNNSEVTKP